MTSRPVVVLWGLLALGLVPPALAEQAPGLGDARVLGPGASDADLRAAIATASAAETIVVHGGVYHGPLLVDREVHLVGVGWPLLAGDGNGSVLLLRAAGASIGGFRIEGSGSRHEANDAGIQVAARGAAVTGNRLRDNLFGVWVDASPGVVVSGNDIAGRASLPPGQRGDAVRVFNSPGSRVEGNRILDGRDVVLWYSDDAIVAQNTITSGRYGIHMMYCPGARLEDNDVRGGSVGAFVMTSDHVHVTGNRMESNRGVSGYGLAFKDTDDADVHGNVLADNQVGLFLDHTPFTTQDAVLIQSNVVAFNDAGIEILPTQGRATFRGNDFVGNVQQVALHGEGSLPATEWTHNYWSDYRGFDADGDGTGDVPYSQRSLFESVRGGSGLGLALQGTPAQRAIEAAGEAFPIIRPRERLQDAAPAMSPLGFAADAGSGPSLSASLVPALSLLAGIALVLASWRMRHARVAAAPTAKARPDPMLAVHGLGVRFGDRIVLSDLHMEASAGECVVLWGPNGSGKSTLLRALLGLLETSGRVLVAGHDVRKDPVQARRAIGYVPQESCLPDWTTRAVLERTARLKGVRPDVERLLRRWGLRDHADTRTSQLSGGLRQRLLLALALLADPPILLLDEPAANLDARAQADVADVVRQARRDGRLVVLATHSEADVRALADRVVRLDAPSPAAPPALDAASMTLLKAPGEV